MTNNVLYEGRAIESMWLCIQDAEFTPESSARLDSALTGSAVAPRIDQMCIEYYAAQNRPWTDAHAAICRPVMLAAIRENTLYLVRANGVSIRSISLTTLCRLLARRTRDCRSDHCRSVFDGQADADLPRSYAASPR